MLGAKNELLCTEFSLFRLQKSCVCNTSLTPLYAYSIPSQNYTRKRFEVLMKCFDKCCFLSCVNVLPVNDSTYCIKERICQHLGVY